jgi:phage-related protein
MSDIIEVARHEMEVFDRPSKRTSLKMLDEIERLRKALAALSFASMGEDEDEGVAFTTQEVWETIYQDRVKDWFSFENLDHARQIIKGEPNA